MTIFAMEKELRKLKDRGHFPIPKITQHGIRIDNRQQAKKTLDAVKVELTRILKSIRESEGKYEKEKEEARLREQQARANKPAQRHRYNYLSPNSSTPIKDTDTRTGNTPSPSNSQIPTGYHQTATPPPLIANTSHQGTQATTQSQATGTSNGLWFQNYQDTNQPRTSTAMQTPAANNRSPASTASITEAVTQLLTHIVDNKKDETSKQIMRNIKTFDETNRTECINWLSQIEAMAKFCNASFRELVCQGMAPAMLHILSDLSELSTDQEIKDVILANYSDIPSTAEVAAKRQNMQIPPMNHSSHSTQDMKQSIG